MFVDNVKTVVYWTINQYSTACVKRWRYLEYVYPLTYCLVLLFSIAFVINKQWALLNVCWINTHSWYLGFIHTHPNIYNRLCIWLAVSPYMNGCAWLRARWSCTLYHSIDFNPSRKITSRLITSTNTLYWQMTARNSWSLDFQIGRCHYWSSSDRARRRHLFCWWMFC